MIVADRKAERKLRGQGVNTIDVGFEAASKRLMDLKKFADALWKAGYRTERLERILLSPD